MQSIEAEISAPDNFEKSETTAPRVEQFSSKNDRHHFMLDNTKYKISFNSEN